MQVWVVDYFTNSWVGNICGEAARDVDMVHLALCREDALKWCIENKDYGNNCGGEPEPAWHWRITPWEIGASDCMTEGEHYSPDGYPCDMEGKEIDPASYTPGMDDYPCQCEGCDGSCDCECEPSKDIDWDEELEEYKHGDKYCAEPTKSDCCVGTCADCEPERERGTFPVYKDEETGMSRVNIEDIEQAYEEEAEDKVRAEFSSFANKIADRMNELADLALDICEELRDEFPER